MATGGRLSMSLQQAVGCHRDSSRRRAGRRVVRHYGEDGACFEAVPCASPPSGQSAQAS